MDTIEQIKLQRNKLARQIASVGEFRPSKLYQNIRKCGNPKYQCAKRRHFTPRMAANTKSQPQDALSQHSTICAGRHAPPSGRAPAFCGSGQMLCDLRPKLRRSKKIRSSAVTGFRQCARRRNAKRDRSFHCLVRRIFFNAVDFVTLETAMRSTAKRLHKLQLLERRIYTS